MKKDIQIKVNTETNQVLINSEILGISSENLQGNIIFKPEPFINGTCRLYVEGLGVIEMDKQEDCYTLPIKSSLLKSPGIDICFKIIEPTNEEGTPIFATKIIHLKVVDTIEDDSEIPEQYPTWIETFDSKIAEIDNKLDEVDSAISNIQDLTSEYNQNAVNKTDDFNTNATNQTSTFDNHVTSKTEEFDADTDDIVGTKKAELDDYEETKENELDTYTNSLKNDLDTYESAKETELNSYTTTKKTELDTHTNNKKTELNTYEQSKETELDTYANGLKDTFNANATTKTSEFDQNASDKTDDFDDNASAKTTAFNDNATAKIAEYDAHVAELQSQVDDLTTLVETELESNEVEGTEIDVSDSAEYRGRIEVKGNTEQEQLSGKNKLDSSKIEQITMNGITCSYNSETQEITFNGTCTKDNTLFQFLDTIIQVTQNVTRVTAYYVRGSVTNYCNLRFFDNNYGAGIISSLSTLPNDKIISKTCDESFVTVNNSFRFNNGSVCNDFTIKILLADDTDTTYEPYCGGQAAPNPSYEIPIKVVTGDNVVKHVGKNLLNIADGTYVNNGVTAVVENGKITLNGTPINGTSFIKIPFHYEYNGLTYSLSANNNEVLGGKTGSENCATLRIDDQPTTQAIFGNKNATVTFVLDDTYNDITIRTGYGLTYNNFVIYPQLEIGQPTSYEPYREESFEVNLGKNLFDKDNANIINAGLSSKVISTSEYNRLLYIPVKSSTTYTIQRRNDGDVNRFRVGSCTVIPANNVSVPNSIENDNATNITITTGVNDKYLAVMYYRTYETVLTEQQILDSIQIEEGSTATSYSKYFTPIELCKIGDYSDILFKNEVGDENYNAELESGAWYKKESIEKLVINGGFQSAGVPNVYYSNRITNYAINNNIPYCKYFKGINNVAAASGMANVDINTMAFINVSGSTTPRFYIKTDKTVSELNIFLSENAPYLYYLLETPTYEKITDTTLISQLEALKKAKWFKGINHWWTETENLEPNLKGTYKQSNNLRLQALEQAVVALGGV